MDSPVAHLLKEALCSIRTIAPERKEALRAEWDRLDPEIKRDDAAQGIRFAANLVGKKAIIFGPACLERLWALAFAYYRFYREIASQRVANPGNRVIDLRRTPELRQAEELLQWAIEADLAAKKGETPPPWPEHLPRPRPDDPDGSDEKCATELFLAAVAYILHHEFAHLRKGHIPPSNLESVDAILQEKEADSEAADWILGMLDDKSSSLYLKRALGVCLGLLWIASLEIYAGHKIVSKTHPPAYDRLFQVVEKHVDDPNSMVWAFMQAVLSIHIQNQKVPHDSDREFGSFKEVADQLVDVISKMYES